MRETHPTFEMIMPSRSLIADMQKCLVTSYISILISHIRDLFILKDSNQVQISGLDVSSLYKLQSCRQDNRSSERARNVFDCLTNKRQLAKTLPFCFFDFVSIMETFGNTRSSS